MVHVDGTVRVADRRSPTSNPRYHAAAQGVRARTGVPVVLNTSFNIKGEAIVCTPRDALRTFWSTGIDALAIGSFLVEKPERAAGDRARGRPAMTRASSSSRRTPTTRPSAWAGPSPATRARGTR